MISALSDRRFHDEVAAYRFCRGTRYGRMARFARIAAASTAFRQMNGKSTRIGVYKCYQCRKPFTVKVGTIFESSHVPLRHWLQAMFLLCSSKKGISANQLAPHLGLHS